MTQTLRSANSRVDVAASPKEISSAQHFIETADRALNGGFDVVTPIPAELESLVTSVLRAIARGERVTVGTIPDELSTTVAAEQLGVSRPTLMKMIAAGDVPAHKIGTHTRVRTEDITRARRLRLEHQRQAFEDLRALDDELGLE